MFLYFMVLGALIGAAAAQKKKFSVVLGAICGAFLGPLAVLLYFVKGDLKNCPQCDKKISAKAKVCPYCAHSMIARKQTTTTNPPAPLLTPEKPVRLKTATPDYLTITKEILKGSTLPQRAIIAISVAAETQNKKALEQALGDDDFSWPWFDQAKAAFKAAGEWPDLAAWTWFETDPDPLEKPSETKKRKRAKRMLLISSIQARYYNTQRHEQLVMMVVDMGCDVTLDISDPAANAVIDGYQFDPTNNKHVPPFFPGDTTSLKSVSPRERSAMA